jgi:drug/metabolite transporter (DMT)-like permease
VWKNGWIWLLALLFVAADKALFIANGMEASKVTVMTLLKQSGCVVTILAGKFIFKEKNVGYKLFCAGIIVIGIVIGVL